ncbi:unnamed protein product [Pleuronectes platessa]|uniref:Uncharacterized protein n=1 Tax=Pleuronectes platessa TaxID=8262 RepID=A0A9N7UNA8_PLEPL|nr:unnamed protein product [Pleuronectes platessa]
MLLSPLCFYFDSHDRCSCFVASAALTLLLCAVGAACLWAAEAEEAARGLNCSSGRGSGRGRAGLHTHTHTQTDTHIQRPTHRQRRKKRDGLAALCCQWSISSELPGPEVCTRGSSRSQL